MKRYVRPMMDAQMFVANEYVGACWGVACNTNEANKIENTLHNHPLGGHRDSECGRFDQQAVVVNSDGDAVGMRELYTEYGILDCTLYSDKTYENPLNAEEIADIKPGETIYWVTKGTWNNTTSVYHHTGKVGSIIENRPNAS